MWPHNDERGREHKDGRTIAASAVTATLRVAGVCVRVRVRVLDVFDVLGDRLVLLSTAGNMIPGWVRSGAMVAARGARRTGTTGDPCGGGAGDVMANSEGQMRSDSRMVYVSETIARCRPCRRKESSVRT